MPHPKLYCITNGNIFGELNITFIPLKMSNILVAENITKTFINHTALDDVSIEVPTGMVYGLLGPNGAGKTTLIRIINHITAPDSGKVYFDGRELTAADVVNIGYLPEERGLYKKMKVGDQAVFFARLKGLSKSDATRELKIWFDKLDIGSWWDKKVEELSKGMAQKIQFVITVLHRPKLLIFDEPFSGFDPINANLLKQEILSLRDQGATIIFSTHNMSSVDEICERITLINRSKNILTGNVRDLRAIYGGNKFQLSYNGEDCLLKEAISPFVKSLNVIEPDRDGNSRIIAELLDIDKRRELIGAANNTVSLIAFEPLLPSMDDIFISAVKSTSQNVIDASSAN